MPEVIECEKLASKLQLAIGSVWDGYALPPDATIMCPLGIKPPMDGALRLDGVEAQGKSVILSFGTGLRIVTEFRLTGWLRPDWLDTRLGYELHPTYEDPKKCARVGFKTDRGVVYFTDPRKFGKLWVWKTEAEMREYSPHLKQGRPVNGPGFTEEFFAGEVKAGSGSVAAFLVDQKRFSGLGNYMRCEVLNQARIDPFRSVKTLTGEEIRKVHGAVGYALDRARGEEGHNWWSVFRKKICGLCGNPVIRTPYQGRGLYWCSCCQV